MGRLGGTPFDAARVTWEPHLIGVPVIVCNHCDHLHVMKVHLQLPLRGLQPISGPSSAGQSNDNPLLQICA
jgi:hypothetical protein